MLDGPHLSGASAAGLHFVADQQDAMLVADLAQFLHEDGWGNHIAAFTLNWLDENGRNLFRGKHGSKQPVFYVTSATKRKFLRVLLGTAWTSAKHIRIAHVG